MSSKVGNAHRLFIYSRRRRSSYVLGYSLKHEQSAGGEHDAALGAYQSQRGDRVARRWLKEMTILLALFLTVSAEAGWWTRFCEKHLGVQLDQSMYDLSPTGWLIAEAERRQIKETWGTIAQWERQELVLMRSKLNLRLLYTNDRREKAEITRAMERGLKVGIIQ